MRSKMQDSYFPLSRARANERGSFTQINDISGGLAAHPAQVPPRKPIADWQPPWWWWWEIMAMVICIASTAGLVALLKSIDNTPLRQWNLPIQPNSAVAFLTTISKVALLVPTASCISQLKWSHFTSAPRKLADLQLFDAASRGPWGSLAFLLQVSSPIKALITVGFSLLTILALGLDASAQQLLQFPTQETEVNDESAIMGVATGYTSKSINAQLPIQALNTKVIPLQFEILNTLRGSTYNSYFTCPQKAARCEWDSLATLGVCSSWNSASVASDGCAMTTAYAPGTRSNVTYAVCNYTLSNPHSENPELAAVLFPQQANLSFRLPSVDSISGNKVFESHFIPGPYIYPSGTEFGEFWALKGPRSTNVSTQASFKPPDAEAFYASFWWCSKSFQGITAEPGGVKYAGKSSERLSFLFNTTNSTTEGGSIFTYAANSTGLNYTLDESTFESLQEYFHSLLMAEASDDTTAIADGSLLAKGGLLYEQDLENITISITDTLTNILRSRALDENAKITDVAGRVFYDETYVRIQWLWLLLPLAETTLVTFLFVFSVVITSKQPLLKDSVLAYLATAAQDDAQTMPGLKITPRTSQQKLDGLAENMIVQLKPDKHQHFKFFQENI
ncbi:hypothetical protein SAMD00023353_0103750 [Rosellinia necatrix]|uniref:Uncharacterized protein n=1 Tax=Rosellinia necatrix TaxID=77044 RepID=A0A1S7UI08_ROSNE|nr:hypothetical protein SAMD00023353_0103750 [Rosellinia necatrix]